MLFWDMSKDLNELKKGNSNNPRNMKLLGDTLDLFFLIQIW
jgi:hypothetical protein